MSVEVTGVEEVFAKLEEKFSERKLNSIEKQALTPAGQYVKNEVKSAVSFFKDTGAEYDEVVVGKPRKIGGVNVIRVGWRGPMERYRLVHLSEFGYTRFGKHYNPRGFGQLQKTYDKIKPYYRVITSGKLREKLL